MNGTGAELWEFEPLERLSHSMLNAPVAFGKAIAEAEKELGPRLRDVERAVAAARDALTRAERRLDEIRSACRNDDDGSSDSAERWAEEAVEQAERRLRAIERAAEEVRYALSRYKNAARDMIEAGRSDFPAGAGFLVDQVELARAYRAVELAGSSRPSSAVEPAAQPPGLAGIALPEGFFWLPLAEVAQEDFIADASAWKKVPREVMESGVRLLYDELLPLMRERPGISQSQLAEIDSRTGRVDPRGLVHPRSLAAIHEIFFSGKEPVSAELYADGRWHVQGRHRASLAAALGHSHIPARRQGGR